MANVNLSNHGSVPNVTPTDVYQLFIHCLEPVSVIAITSTNNGDNSGDDIVNSPVVTQDNNPQDVNQVTVQNVSSVQTSQHDTYILNEGGDVSVVVDNETTKKLRTQVEDTMQM
jgi:hypothetical protein